MSRRLLLALLGALTIAGAVAACGLRSALVAWFSPSYRQEGGASPIAPEVESQDTIPVSLALLASGFDLPTDVQFVPGEKDLAVVLEKAGHARWVSLADGATGVLMEMDVLEASEQGLLGLAFHPRFRENRKVYTNATVESGNKEVTQIAEWTAPANLRQGRLGAKRVILEVEQPYPNHNAGQLAFGPDGLLYIGMGDGGWIGDPHGHGQNPRTLLGAMLRVDVDRAEGGRAYGIPPDNPFADGKAGAPEIFAIGLRNPWRFSFDPRGRLVVADVGQDRWEEIDLLEKGMNLGWNVREGRHCYKPAEGCRTDGLVDPVHEYGHDQGQSVTGGYVYTGGRIPALRGRYVFGDFVTGRMWALVLPERAPRAGESPPPADVKPLGKWPILPSTFAVDADGELYVADFARGGLYRFDR